MADTVTVLLFKPSGKFYTEEQWEVPAGAVVPADMERSPDFRRISGGAVLIDSQEPWGYPHLFPAEPPAGPVGGEDTPDAPAGPESGAEPRGEGVLLFVSGPMTGLPDRNRPAFDEAARALREAGYDVISPAETAWPDDVAWEIRLRDALRQMLGCDGVAFLEGWPGSKGSRIEVKLARDTGIPATWVQTWLAEAAAQKAGEKP